MQAVAEKKEEKKEKGINVEQKDSC